MTYYDTIIIFTYRTDVQKIFVIVHSFEHGSDATVNRKKSKEMPGMYW